MRRPLSFIVAFKIQISVVVKSKILKNHKKIFEFQCSHLQEDSDVSDVAKTSQVSDYERKWIQLLESEWWL